MPGCGAAALLCFDRERAATFAGIQMPIQSYRDLIVWQRAMDLLTECYRVARLLPPSETYALGAHLERAAVAVAAHIAGGHARERAEFLESLTGATASLREVETLLLAATRVCLLSADQIQTGMQLGDEVGRMLTALRRSLGAPHLQPGATGHAASLASGAGIAPLSVG